MFDRRQNIAHRAFSGLDLLIDFATLGEYGIEPLPADGHCDERRHGAGLSRRADGWEAFSQARRGACRPGRPLTARA